jgi:von Willebrand factor type A domain
MINRFLILATALTLAACSSNASSNDSGYGGGTTGGKSGGTSGSTAGGASSSESSPSGTSTSGSSSGNAIQAGVLTAGVWDDNKNFDVFVPYQTGLAQVQGFLPFTPAEQAAAHAAHAQEQRAHQKLDIALVLDTTGSMGDEIAYLQREFAALSSSISERFPNADQRWSLVLYKDDGDKYVAKPFDFQSNLSEFKTNLAVAEGSGGGDTPEAVHAGLSGAAALGWRQDPSVAKLMFWVADAPHHAGKEREVASSVRAAAQKGIHVYPVASSGVDELTEGSMRAIAQLTHGRYMFLTNDSGIGNDHKEPTTPCYFVTKLDKAILRMVDIEMSGSYREPLAAEIIRTGGDPKDGRCVSGSRTFELF